MPVQNVPWPIVEHRLHPFDLAPGHLVKVSPGGKALPQEPVGVLVGAPFPGTVGMRKVDRHLRLAGEAPMVAHLLPLVVGEGSAELGRQGPDGLDKGLSHRGCMLGLQWDHQGKPRGAFDESPQR